MSEQQPKFEWHGKVYWNNLRIGLIGASALFGIYNLVSPDGSYINALNGIGVTGLVYFYNKIRLLQIEEATQKFHFLATPCVHCATPCPLTDIAKKWTYDSDISKIADETHARFIRLFPNQDKYQFRGKDGLLRTLVNNGEGEIHCDINDNQ